MRGRGALLMRLWPWQGSWGLGARRGARLARATRAGRRRRAAPAVRGPGGRAHPRHGGACRRVERGEALSGGSLHAISHRGRGRGRCLLDEGTVSADRGRHMRGVRRQSACAELTRRGIRNVRVRAPKTSECVRRSVRSVTVRAPIPTEGVRVVWGDGVPREGHVRVKEDTSPRREGV